MRNYKSEIFLKNLNKALKILIKIYDSKGDLFEDFPSFVDLFYEAIKVLKKEERFDIVLLNKIREILKFRRTYSVLELCDKVNEVNVWFEDSWNAAQSFHKYWGLPSKKVGNIVERYRQILLQGFLELVFRKGIGLTEVDAIRSFRYNMGGRLPEEYFVNLVRGWLSEDLARLWIEDNAKALEAKLVPIAHDADRKIRFKSARMGKGRIISGEPDFIVEFKNRRKQIYLESQRVDRGRLKETNENGERPVNIPSHRPEVERKALKDQKGMIIFLFNEGTSTIPPEIAVVVNPRKNKKLRKREGDLFVWAKFFPVNTNEARKELSKALS